MQIPNVLVTQIRESKCVLVLGTGASVGATANNRPSSPFSGAALARAISERFLGGEFSDQPLTTVSEYAISEASLFDVQDFVRGIFDPLEPAKFHLSVSNSLSGRHWELDQGPAVGDRTDIVQLGTGHHVSAGEGQRRVALQRRVAAYLVVGGQTPGATQRCLNPGFSERIGNSRRTGAKRVLNGRFAPVYSATDATGRAVMP